MKDNDIARIALKVDLTNMSGVARLLCKIGRLYLTCFHETPGIKNL